MHIPLSPRGPDHYLIIDVEATCADDGSVPRGQMEIIELGAVLVDARTLAVIDEYQSFVRPVRHPRLTDFCQQLTSIRQEQVDEAPRFLEALDGLTRSLVAGRDPLFSSWGAYDRGQIRQDCELHGMAYPLGIHHLNLKARFSERRQTSRKFGMAAALRLVGLPLLGTHHRGIDDARNIAQLLPYIL